MVLDWWLLILLGSIASMIETSTILYKQVPILRLYHTFLYIFWMVAQGFPQQRKGRERFDARHQNTRNMLILCELRKLIIYLYLCSFPTLWHLFWGVYIYIYIHKIQYNRRKFRSQTSNNMDRWKAEQGRGREKRKIRREKIRRERVRGQKIQMREKVGKSRNTVFFQWFVAPEGRKVGSLKRRVRTQLATGTMKNCTPLWREAHFQVKMLKTPGVRTTFGSCDIEKVHAVVARSTFPSQNVQNTSASDHFWKLRCRKSARRCGAKHIS